MANITIDETINIGDQLRVTLDGIDYDGYINSLGSFVPFTNDTQLFPFNLQLSGSDTGIGGGTAK